MVSSWPMGKRIMIIVLAVTVFSVLAFAIISFKTLNDAAYANGKSQLETTVMQSIAKMNQDYQTLLQLSEQLMPHGPVGQVMQELLDASDSYGLGVAKRNLARAFVIHGGLTSQVMLYYNQSTGSITFTNYIYDGKMAEKLHNNVIYKNVFLEFHAVHQTQYRYSSYPVISIAREAVFSNESVLVMYLELLSSVPNLINEVSSSVGVPYIFIQLDSDGAIRYSSAPGDLSPGTYFPLDEETFGVYQNYYYAWNKLSFGSACVVLAPRASYTKAVASWLRQTLIVALFVSLVVMIATWLMYQHVFRGLKIFQEEIDRTLKEDLEPVTQETKIHELDQLLHQFDEMKGSIKLSMETIADKERKQAQKEKELLMYQINPHFLLNTLNSLHWLSLMKGQGELSNYVTSLNQILSYNLGKSVPNPSLRDELHFLKLYLNIEQMRHDFRVQFVIQEGPHLDLKTPRLLLQPIVENAVGHGLDNEGSLEIQVTHPAGGNYVNIKISDDGCGISAEHMELIRNNLQRGLGLKYVQTAIDVFYEGKAKFEILDQIERGTTVSLSLPLA